jgi:uncharacterized protein (DUF305 family)
MHTRSATLATAIVAVALTAGACGGGGHGTGVASLANSHATTTVKKKSKAAAKQEMQDASLAFARCMREHGVDMPDPTFTDNGNGGGGFAIKQAGPAGGARPADATLQAAQTVCQSIMDKAEQDMPRPSPQEQAKMRDQALKFAKCMRAHGIDMPDPTFDDSGGAKIEMHADGSANNGSGHVSNGKGAAPPPPGDNPKMEAAAKACGGPGGGGPGFSTNSESK